MRELDPDRLNQSRSPRDYLRLGDWHQLFFAQMMPARDARGQRPYVHALSRRPVSPQARRWRPDAEHPVLFDLARDWTKFNRRTDARHDLPAVQAGRAAAAHAAERRGWNRALTEMMNRAIVAVLSMEHPPRRLKWCDIEGLTKRQYPVERVAEVLAEMRLFHDDREVGPRVRIERQLNSFPMKIRGEAQAWADMLLSGEPRARRLGEQTVARYVQAAVPVLRHWSTRYQSLRQVRTSDIESAVAPLPPAQRRDAMIALRSLFRCLKRQRMVFADPAETLNVGAHKASIPRPLDTQQLQRAFQAAGADPATSAMFLLVATQAIRTQAIADLVIDEVNLGDGQVQIRGTWRPLDALTRRAIHRYLDERRARWPNSGNPHLFITQQTANEEEPMSTPAIKALFRTTGVTVEQLRQDRLLEEARQSPGDPLHLMAMFKVTTGTALRYAFAAAPAGHALLEGNAPAADWTPAR